MQKFDFLSLSKSHNCDLGYSLFLIRRRLTGKGFKGDGSGESVKKPTQPNHKQMI